MTCLVLLSVDSALAALSFASRLLQANLFLMCWRKCSCTFAVNLHTIRMHLCTLDIACLAFNPNFMLRPNCLHSIVVTVFAAAIGL